MTKAGQQKRKVEADIAEYLRDKAQEVASADIVRVNRTASIAIGREHAFLEDLHDVLVDAFSGLPALKPEKKQKKARGKTERILNLIFSDTHYGSALDPREVKHKYGSVEEARRTAAVCRQAANYKLDHRDETELHLHLLGDIIQGQLHDMRDGLPLAEQVASAIRILVQAIRYLARAFPKGVRVRCTPGNHGRNTARHRDRATNQKWDSIETMIYFALKEACAHLANVTIELNYEPKYDFVSFNKVGLGTHGDTVINPGYPGRSIDVAGIKKQVDSINNARVVKGEKPYSLFIMGHVHTGAMVHLPGGVIVMTNGCLIPPDPYANSIGIFDTACGQWMWESTPDHIVGDARFVNVGEDNDRDESLDSIIQPFKGL